MAFFAKSVPLKVGTAATALTSLAFAYSIQRDGKRMSQRKVTQKSLGDKQTHKLHTGELSPLLQHVIRPETENEVDSKGVPVR